MIRGREAKSDEFASDVLVTVHLYSYLGCLSLPPIRFKQRGHFCTSDFGSPELGLHHKIRTGLPGADDPCIGESTRSIVAVAGSGQAPAQSANDKRQIVLNFRLRLVEILRPQIF